MLKKKNTLTNSLMIKKTKTKTKCTKNTFEESIWRQPNISFLSKMELIFIK